MGASIPDGWMGLDMGPGTAADFSDVILDARPVLWNGPMGVFEDPRFEAGTRTVAEAVAEYHGLHRRRRGRLAPPPWPSSVWPTGSTTSAPAAAPRSSCSRQGDLPGLVALRASAERLTLVVELPVTAI